MNVTLCALFASNFASSPFLISSSNVIHSKISKSFTHFLFTEGSFHCHYSHFSRFLKTPLVVHTLSFTGNYRTRIETSSRDIEVTSSSFYDMIGPVISVENGDLNLSKVSILQISEGGAIVCSSGGSMSFNDVCAGTATAVDMFSFTDVDKVTLNGVGVTFQDDSSADFSLSGVKQIIKATYINSSRGSFQSHFSIMDSKMATLRFIILDSVVTTSFIYQQNTKKVEIDTGYVNLLDSVTITVGTDSIMEMESVSFTKTVSFSILPESDGSSAGVLVCTNCMFNVTYDASGAIAVFEGCTNETVSEIHYVNQLYGCKETYENGYEPSQYSHAPEFNLGTKDNGGLLLGVLGIVLMSILLILVILIVVFICMKSYGELRQVLVFVDEGEKWKELWNVINQQRTAVRREHGPITIEDAERQRRRLRRHGAADTLIEKPIDEWEEIFNPEIPLSSEEMEDSKSDDKETDSNIGLMLTRSGRQRIDPVVEEETESEPEGKKESENLRVETSSGTNSQEEEEEEEESSESVESGSDGYADSSSDIII